MNGRKEACDKGARCDQHRYNQPTLTVKSTSSTVMVANAIVIRAEARRRKM
jgi:hypothetical protein